jgi:phosphate-selective porin
LNWHPEKNLRVMLNYVRAFGGGLGGGGGRRARAGVDTVQLRFQVAY